METVNVWQKKWFRVTTWTLIALILFGLGAATNGNTSELEKSRQANRDLVSANAEAQNHVSDLENKLETLKTARTPETKSTVKEVSSKECQDAVLTALQLAYDYNTLVGHIGEAIQELGDNPYYDMSSVVRESNSVTDRLAPALAPALACDPSISSKLVLQ